MEPTKLPVLKLDIQFMTQSSFEADILKAVNCITRHLRADLTENQKATVRRIVTTLKGDFKKRWLKAGRNSGKFTSANSVWLNSPITVPKSLSHLVLSATTTPAASLSAFASSSTGALSASSASIEVQSSSFVPSSSNISETSTTPTAGSGSSQFSASSLSTSSLPVPTTSFTASSAAGPSSVPTRRRVADLRRSAAL